MSHCSRGKEEPLTATNGIKPESPRLIDLFGIPSPFALFLNKDACLIKWASWVLPGAPFVKWRNRLLQRISTMLVTMYLFLKL